MSITSRIVGAEGTQLKIYKERRTKVRLFCSIIYLYQT